MRVGVRADAVERDVAEVEQAAPADDDVEAEREQHVERRCRTRPCGCSRRARRAGSSANAAHEEHEPRPPRRPRSALLDLADAARARRERRSPWRATHSSCPIAGPDGSWRSGRARSYLLDPRLAEQARSAGTA